jgi:hypothetical protein
VMGTLPSDQSLVHLTKFLSRGFYRRTDSPPVFERCVRKEGCCARKGRTLALRLKVPHNAPNVLRQLLFSAPRSFAGEWNDYSLGSITLVGW